MTNRQNQKSDRGRFPKGTSGNPAGRPPGSRNKSTLLLEQMLESEAPEVTQKLIELAKKGEPQALRLFMERALPARKDRLVHLELRATEGPADPPLTVRDLVRAVAEGRLTPGEGEQCASILNSEFQMKAGDGLLQRVAELESVLPDLRHYKREMSDFVAGQQSRFREEAPVDPETTD